MGIINYLQLSSVRYLHTVKRLHSTHLIYTICKIMSMSQNKMKLNNTITQ